MTERGKGKGDGQVIDRQFCGKKVRSHLQTAAFFFIIRHSFCGGVDLCMYYLWLKKSPCRSRCLLCSILDSLPVNQKRFPTYRTLLIIRKREKKGKWERLLTPFFLAAECFSSEKKKGNSVVCGGAGGTVNNSFSISSICFAGKERKEKVQTASRKFSTIFFWEISWIFLAFGRGECLL